MDYVDMMFMRRASVYLEKFKDTGNGVFNCRCPICGDSRKDKTKARGYLIDKGENVIYHCHNCGSPEVRSLGKLINFLSPSLYQEYRREKFGNKFKTNNKSVNPDDYDDPAKDLFIDKEFLQENNLERKKRASERLLKDCIPLPLLEEDHKAWVYLNSRKLAKGDIEKLYYLDNINKLTSKIDKYKDTTFPNHDAIMIPFVDFEGIINCIQLRIMVEKTKMRYVTLYINEDKSKAIYGLNYIDKEKTVYACEGPFNSMFLDNAIAFAGSSQSNKINFIKDYIKDYVIVYDPDYKINVQVRKIIEKTINQGHKVVLYDDKYFKTDDDINDVVIRLGWTKKELMDYIESRTFSGLNAKLELSKYDTPPEPKKASFEQKSTLKEKLERSIRR